MTLVASNGHQLHSPLGTPCHDGDDDDDGDDDGDDGDDDGGDGDVLMSQLGLSRLLSRSKMMSSCFDKICYYCR